MRFLKINIGVWPHTGWRLQWTVDSITSAYEILIQRASGPEGPWSDVDVVDYATIAYEDNISSYRGFNTLLFYKLTIREVATGDSIVESKAVTTDKAGSKITAEIIRQHELTLKGTNSHPGYGNWDFACFKRTKFGTLCHFCTDVNTGERGVVARCAQCRGTGYLEGWANPVKFKARILVPEQKTTMIEVYGPSEEIVKQFFTAAFPILEPGDILVQKDTGKVWRVKNNTLSRPQGVVVSQSFTVSGIDHQKIEGTLIYPGEE